MAFLMLGFVGLYMVKYKVQTVKVQVTAAQKQLVEDRKNLRVLEAEWTYLNRPERLEALSQKYLDVKPIHGQQLAEYSSIPYASSATSVAKQDHTTSSSTLVKFVSRGTGNDADSDNDE
jgi:hypothetical protein